MDQEVSSMIVARDQFLSWNMISARQSDWTDSTSAAARYSFFQARNAHGLALIEDCAHVLSGEVEGKSLGTIGDAAVFSWRKFLPIYDGAELVINRPVRQVAIQWTSEGGLFTLKVAANMLDASLGR